MAPERLADLPTCWTQIQLAHRDGPEGAVAMRELVSRYHDAVRRYLHLKLNNPEVADEILQVFWTKVIEHKLVLADPTKGRFRDYLRGVLQHLVADHFRRLRPSLPYPDDLVDPRLRDAQYDTVWRDAVLKRARLRLETYQTVTPNNHYASALNLRIRHPDAPIDSIAEQLGNQIGRSVSAPAFRKTLQRARAKFLALLIEELRDTIHPATDADVEDEMVELGLGHLYRKHAQQRESDPASPVPG